MGGERGPFRNARYWVASATALEWVSCVPRGPRNRIAKVFILEGRTGSGEGEGKKKRRKVWLPLRCPFVRSFSHLFNLTSKDDAHEIFWRCGNRISQSSAAMANTSIGAFSSLCGCAVWHCPQEKEIACEFIAARVAFARSSALR